MSIDEEKMADSGVDALLDRLARIKNTDVENLWRRVELSAGKIETRRGKRRMLHYAAAIVAPLLLAGGAWLYLRSHSADDAHIERIAEQITLTISDGQQIALDMEAINDTVAMRDNVAMILNNGQLIYENQTGTQTTDPPFTTLRVPKGKRFDMVMADGTHVWLNADSHIRFPLNFTDGERRVTLEGEAYFEVAHNEHKPFLVETDGQLLKVLGTKFNISAYADQEIISTTLVEGSVALEAGDGANITLTPGRQARLYRGNAAAGYIEGPAKGDPTAWRNDLFLTDGDRLEDVFVKLSRWYDIEYTFTDREAADLVLRGNLPMYDDIETVLELIEMSGHVTLETKGKNVKIRIK